MEWGQFTAKKLQLSPPLPWRKKQKEGEEITFDYGKHSLWHLWRGNEYSLAIPQMGEKNLGFLKKAPIFLIGYKLMLNTEISLTSKFTFPFQNLLPLLLY